MMTSGAFISKAIDRTNSNTTRQFESEHMARTRPPRLGERMAAEAMELAFDDNRQAWLLQPDGSYLHAWPEKGETVRVAQEVLMQRAETDQGNA